MKAAPEEQSSFRVWSMSCSALFLGLTLASQVINAATERCPNPNTLTGQSDPDHFRYVPVGGAPSAVPEPCNSCDDPINTEVAACKVFRFMHSADCAGDFCQDEQGIFNLYRSFTSQFSLQYDTRYRDPVKYPKAVGENCRFIVWALNPSIGLEDTHTRTDYPYWNHAWRASQHLVKPAFPEDWLGLIIQSPIDRGQHQLHIHIGRLFPDYRKAIDHLQKDPTVTQQIVIRDRLFFARYTLNAPRKGPFTGANPFDVASSMIPEGLSGIPEYGVMAAISSDRKGVFVLAAKGLERDQLNYRANQACRLVAPVPSKSSRFDSIWSDH